LLTTIARHAKAPSPGAAPGLPPATPGLVKKQLAGIRR
jgi:hypothetical protein